MRGRHSRGSCSCLGQRERLQVKMGGSDAPKKRLLVRPHVWYIVRGFCIAVS